MNIIEEVDQGTIIDIQGGLQVERKIQEKGKEIDIIQNLDPTQGTKSQKNQNQDLDPDPDQEENQTQEQKDTTDNSI